MHLYLERQALHPRGSLRRLRTSIGRSWQELVEWVGTLPDVHPESMAFGLMIRRLRHRLGLGHGAHGFSPTCELCAAEALAYFDGDESELLAAYEQALSEINATMRTIEMRARKRALAWAV